MAGKRQHYIPRLLLRGFLATPVQEAERTWLHRTGEPAKLVGIRDVGVQENFYSKLGSEGAPTLDDLITSLEGEIDRDLKTIRIASTGANIDAGLAARLVTHLVLRTAHVRSMFTQASGLILNEITSLVTDTDGMRRYLGIDSSDPARVSETLVDDVLKKLPLATLSLPPAFARRVIRFWIREHFHSFYEQIQPAASHALEQIKRSMSGAIRDGHNRALAMTDEVRWISDLAALSWKTHSFTGAILPDCVVLAREIGGGFTPLLLSNRQQIDTVVLPIAHDRLLVGSTIADDNIAVPSINEASALCSDSFFVSHAENDGAGLSNMIGQRCAQAIGAVVNEALSDFRSPNADTVSEQRFERQLAKGEFPGSFSFSLTCTDFADAETAARLGEILKVVVLEIGRDKPLTTLDGITFAADYASALERLDRGDPALPSERSRPRAYGRAVAKCVRVSRQGVFKEHLVFDAVLADHLLADDSDRRALGIHMVVSMLAGVSHSAIYESRLNDRSAAPSDCVTEWLHKATSTAPGRYFAARESAFSDPSSGLRYATLIRDSLASAREQIRNARLAYRLDINLDKLLDVAVLQFSFVLAHAAEWLGHRDGLPSQDAFPGASLLDDLKVDGLDHWLELFGRDLRRLYDVDGQFTAENIFALGQHVERLLWTVQIFPWPTESDLLYVSVGDDARLLQSQSGRAT